MTKRIGAAVTYNDQYAEIRSWIRATAKEIVDAVQRSDVPLSHVGQIVESRLWEFTVVHGLILSSGGQCESRGSQKSPIQSDPDCRYGHS